MEGCPSCRKGDVVDGTEATEVLEDPGALYGADIPALAPAPARTINVGTRLRVRLTAPVVTSFAGSPVTAAVADDVLLGGDVALPAGTVLVGEAFGTYLDDRAQVTFSALDPRRPHGPVSAALPSGRTAVSAFLGAS